jgi:pimeloyl-ACP methyl ester carboxylesterase
MPIKINGAELFYKESGTGPETIVFSHGLLMDHTMFEDQRRAFEGQYRVIAYDHRGQGRSQDTGSGYDMDSLTEDAAGLIRALNAAPCHFAGLSMGGFVGLRLAARHPELVKSLTLMNTAANSEPFVSRFKYNLLGQMVKVVSPGPFVSIAVKELFGRSTRNDPAKRAMVAAWTEKLRARPRNLAYSLLEVMNRKEALSELKAIRCPTVVITGEDDTAQPARNSEQIAAGIAGARLVRIPACGHSSSLEQPEAVTAAMRDVMKTAK